MQFGNAMNVSTIAMYYSIGAAFDLIMILDNLDVFGILFWHFQAMYAPSWSHEVCETPQMLANRDWQ